MKKFLATLTLVFALTLNAPLASAASSYDGFDVFEVLDVTDEKPDSVESSTDLIENIQDEAEEKNTSIAGAVILRAINILSLLIGTFAFLVIMYGGIIMITAGGDESSTDRAKGMITQAILGVVLAFLSYFIVAFVQSFFY